MNRRMWIMFAVLSAAALGCTSGEEQCNGARVEAYDAWAAVAEALDAQAAAVVEAPVAGSGDSAAAATAAPPNRYGIEGADPEAVRVARLRREASLEADRRRGGLSRRATQARQFRDLARGGALAYRDATRAELEAFAPLLDAALLDRVERATSSHWEACSAVSP